MANQHKCGINSTHWSQVLISGQNLVIKKEVTDLEDSQPTRFTPSSSTSNEANRPKLQSQATFSFDADIVEITEQISRSDTRQWSGVVVVTDDVPYLTRNVVKRAAAAASICNGVPGDTPHLERAIFEEELDFSEITRSVDTPPSPSVKKEDQQLIESSTAATDELNNCSREEIERSLSLMRDENKSLLEQVDQLKSHLDSRDRELDHLLQLVRRRNDETQCVDSEQPTLRENRVWYGGHVFARSSHKPMNGNMHWQCVKQRTRGCLARITIQPDGQFVITNPKHTHA